MSPRDVSILRGLVDRIDPGDAGAHNNLGVVFFQKGLVEDAVRAFERALELDPRLEVARRNAEVAYLETGHFRHRVRELEARLEADPDDPGTRDALARTFLLAGDPGSAARHWRALLEQSPGSVPVLLDLATAEMERGQKGRAVVLLEHAALAAPGDPAVHLQLAEILYHRDDHEQAEEAVRRALALDDAGAPGWVLLARILNAMDRTVESNTALERAERLDPEGLKAGAHLSLERYRSARKARRARGPEPETVDAPLGRFARAMELRREGDLEAAAEELARALEGGDDSFEVRQALAELRLLQGAAELAVPLYDRLTRDREESPKLWNERGVALHRAGRLDEAVESYRRAVALDYNYALGWSNLGVARLQREEVEAGERALRKATEGAAPTEVLWNLALHLVRAERPGEAVEACRVALEQDDRIAESWSRLGIALYQAERPSDARDALLRALELDASLAQARYQLGFALSALGDFRGALRETKRALELEPVYPTPRYHLLVDVQFERGTLPAPDGDVPERVRAGTEIPTFDFRSEQLERVFAGFSAPEPEPEANIDEPLREARAALRRGQLGRASDAVARALASAPGSTAALSLHGDVLLEQGFPGEALERYDAVLRTSSDAGETRRAAGHRIRALLDLERPDEAVAAARAGRRDGVPDAGWLLGRALLAAGDVSEAARVLAAEASSGGASPRVTLTYGQALLAAGRDGAAEAAFREALRAGPDAVAARVGLGSALAAQGRVEEAEAQYRTAVETLPSYGRAALGLAELAWRGDRREEAVATLADLLALDPMHVPALVRLGEWLDILGRREQARRALRRALRLDPDHSAARAALNRRPAPSGERAAREPVPKSAAAASG